MFLFFILLENEHYCVIHMLLGSINKLSKETFEDPLFLPQGTTDFSRPCLTRICSILT